MAMALDPNNNIQIISWLFIEFILIYRSVEVLGRAESQEARVVSRPMDMPSA
jgi:hypothetical protein